MKKYFVLAFSTLILSILIFFINSGTNPGLTAFEIFKTLIDSRPKHCIDDSCINSVVFSELPEFPNDFSGDKFSREDVWRQPEFYPNFETEGIKYYIDPPGGYLGTQGFGVYPAENRINAKTGDEIEVETFLYSAWFVVNYQGLKLVPFVDDSAKNYFDVEISPDTILLEPTFPLFTYNWTQKVKMKVKIKNPSTGSYKIGIDVVAPPKERENGWFDEFKGRYISAGVISVGNPMYALNINIS